MDLFNLLKRDHDAFASMLDCLMAEQDTKKDSIRDVQDELADLLRVHTKMEEQFLYPRLKGVQAIGHLLEDSYEEHGRADHILRELFQQPIKSEAWVEQCRELLNLLGHHAEEEEQRLFPIAHRVLEEAEMEEIYEQMIEFRRDNLVPAGE